MNAAGKEWYKWAIKQRKRKLAKIIATHHAKAYERRKRYYKTRR